jgi:hypothetical protein
MGRLLSYRRGQPDMLISAEDKATHKERFLAVGVRTGIPDQAAGTAV